MQLNPPPLYHHHHHHPTTTTTTTTTATTEHSNSQEQREPQEGFLLNLTPLPTKVSFLTRQADQQSTRLEGELQFKLLLANRYAFQELRLNLNGTETNSERQQELELINQTITLWKRNNSSTENPPSLSPFRFNLPQHLPQCIHLQNKDGINYRLTASLSYHQDQPPLCKQAVLSIPIHITTHSKPEPLLPTPTTDDEEQQHFSLSPVEIKTLSPTPIFVTLSQTLLRHSEPLAIQVRIPPPTEELINDKGLQLRSVRAELRRHIRQRSAPENQVTTVLAISGKSCRFSSSRAVFLRLRLHSCLARTSGTGGEGGESSGEGGMGEERVGISRCETVSQTTGLFEVSFSVGVRVQISAGDGARQDLELVQEVGLEPDWPASPAATGKAREALAESPASEPDGPGPAPTYFETELRDAQPSTSQLIDMDLHRLGPLLDWQEEEDEEEEEEEYDGYESFSARVGQDGPAPPTIDEDESPPPAPDTPPEGLQLQSPVLVPPEPAQYLPELVQQPVGCDLADHIHAFPIPPPDAHLSSRPTEIDSGRPPAYAPGWSAAGLPQHPPPALILPPVAASSETSSLEPPPYAANCS
ncbi:hypothetical protein PGT21_032164 [Puccinia graminis f. sp. tritici]|uniref:Uncharacterized protein n=1 Tax=Puccinia graminis f. sp. tritici TaxID=56615 RepID=A0A5B0MIL1_PUCGR|nr:hypothetical protein PGTUg99_033312 [Puccinia graminis f. sp. tritici]KAA1091364.1 hypothetical protein PGT21_032164 [Puccinia graminis f. sp. tritici]